MMDALNTDSAQHCCKGASLPKGYFSCVVPGQMLQVMFHLHWFNASLDQHRFFGFFLELIQHEDEQIMTEFSRWGELNL